MNPRIRLISLVFMALALPALLVSWLFYSTTALQWLLSSATRFLPGHLSYQGVTGRLAGPLALAALRYEDESMVLAIERLELDWRPLRLLRGELYVSRLAGHGAGLQLAPRAKPSAAKPTTSPPRPELKLPLAVHLGELSLEDLRITRDAGPLLIQRLSLSAGFREGRLRLQAFHAEMPRLKMQGHGNLATAGAYPLDLTLRFSATPPGLAPFEGALAATGDLDSLAVRQTLTSPFNSRLEATIENPLGTLRWQARLIVEDLDPATLQPQWEATKEKALQLRGQIEGGGGLARFTVDAALQATWRGIPLAGRLRAGHEPGRLKIGSLALSLPGGDTLFSSAGRLDYGDAPPRIDLRGHWRALRWPLSGTPVLQSRAGDFRLQGTPEDYGLHLDADLDSPQLAIQRLVLRLRGKKQAWQIERLQARLLDGQLQAQGILEGDPATPAGMQWRFQAKGKGLNPARRWPDWPGRVDFSLAGKGRGLPQGEDRAGFTATLVLRHLGGELRGQALTGSGRLELADDTLRLRPLVLGAGRARLALSGEVGRRWALGWYLDLPRLDALLPHAAGTLLARGSLSGPRTDPLVDLDARGRGLRYRQHRIGQLSTRVQWHPGEERPARLTVNALDLHIGTQTLAQVSIQGAGQSTRHEVNLWLDGSSYQLLAQARGSWEDQVWRGRLPRLRLGLFDGSIWEGRLEEEITLSASAAALPRWCLSAAPRRLCLEGAWQRMRGWHAALAGEGLPLTLVQPWLPPALALSGDVSLDAALQGDERQAVHGRLTLRSPGGRLVFETGRTGRDERIPLAYRNLQLTGRLLQGRLSLQADADLGTQGRLAGDLSLPVPALGAGDDKVAGNLALTLRELRPIALVVPAVEEVGGTLRARLRAGGTLAAPEIDLQLLLEEGRFQLPTLAIAPRDIRIEARSHAGALLFEGRARSGPGRVTVSGRFQPARERPWQLTLDVQGERFLAADTREYRVLLSPALRLALDPATGSLSGTLRIPEAKLRPRRLAASTPRPSPDVIVIDEGTAKPALPFRLTSTVRLELGEAVKFDGFGLEARLAGALTITDRPGELVTATGELRVVEGRYKAYGQDLRIQRGRLIFVGGPIDNPGLDIRAVRKIEDVTAGLHITGDALQPLLRIFSDPPMSETDALAYLLLGRPPQQDDRSDEERISAAAAALGIGGASLLGKRLGERLGLEEVTVESDRDSGEIQLKLGTYLSPRLYVGYGWGMVEQINTFLVRYQLSERIAIEAQSSSEAVGGDILFSLER